VNALSLDDRLLRSTSGLCHVCKHVVPARVVASEGRVYMDKVCGEHGPSRVLIAESVQWFERIVATTSALKPPIHTPKAVTDGCPLDCGPCTDHAQRMHLPVLVVTSRCDLDCPICYTHNRNDDPYNMSRAELDGIISHLPKLAPDARIVNVTGGEPTQHPDLEGLLSRLDEAGVDRITLSTHGLRLLRDEAFVDVLARLRVRVVLSFDSLTEAGNRTMLGGNHLTAKMRILDVLERKGIATTLLPVMAAGVNDHEVGDFIRLMLSRACVRSLELHPMTFTGQSGAGFDRETRYTTDRLLADIEEHSHGLVRVADFVPSPLAHPLCYQVTYLLHVGERWLPFARFMPADTYRDLLALGLYMVPGKEMEAIFADVMQRLWAGEHECEDSDAVLAALRNVIDKVFSPALSAEERLVAAECEIKAIYIHTHMDEETFDTERVRACCVGMPSADGTSIPSCSYNVLYRERDARFIEPKSTAKAPTGLVTLRLRADA
jgi:uncharacterized radical SAM superfamily Fe-S cluster-containing enzyme